MRRVTVSLAMVGMLLFGIAAYAAGEHRLLSPSSLAAADDCQTFSQTGKAVCGDFLKYWQDHGGLAQQGYPISDVFDEKSETDGITHKVQYFERAVFEAHPENAPPNNVLLSLLGSQKYKTKYPNGAPSGAPAPVTQPTATVAAPVANVYPQRNVHGPLAVTLWSVRDPAPADTYSAPKSGNRLVAFDITIENAGTGTQHYNAFETSLQTTDDRVYSCDASSTLQPALSYGDLAPGEKARGWVVAEIPQGSGLATFKYLDFGNNPVTFDVHK
jgi:hypothetical protein